MDPLAKAALTAAGRVVLRRAADLLPNNNRRVDETWTSMLQEMVLAVEAAFRAHLGHHEEKDPEFAQRLAAALDERESRALFFRLGTEAAQATTTERMRMLAHALAGVYTPDLDAEMRSRVCRAVIALEPSDVIALRRARSIEPTKGTNIVSGELRMSIPPERDYEALIVAGCLADANVYGGGVYVTDLGHAVAKVLELWR